MNFALYRAAKWSNNGKCIIVTNNTDYTATYTCKCGSRYNGTYCDNCAEGYEQFDGSSGMYCLNNICFDENNIECNKVGKCSEVDFMG